MLHALRLWTRQRNMTAATFCAIVSNAQAVRWGFHLMASAPEMLLQLLEAQFWKLARQLGGGVRML